MGRPLAGPLAGYLKAVWPEISGSVFGRFSAKLGPQTPLERRVSSCSAGCTKNQPGTPILRPLRGTKKSDQTAFTYPFRGWGHIPAPTGSRRRHGQWEPRRGRWELGFGLNAGGKRLVAVLNNVAEPHGRG